MFSTLSPTGTRAPIKPSGCWSFWGFPAAFYQAYHESNPIDGGYRDRRDLYNLYHLLNHLNLFGGSYLSSVRRILERYAL